MKSKKKAGPAIKRFLADLGREMRDKYPRSYKVGPLVMQQRMRAVLEKFSGQRFSECKNEIRTEVEAAVIELAKRVPAEQDEALQ